MSQISDHRLKMPACDLQKPQQHSITHEPVSIGQPKRNRAMDALDPAAQVSINTCGVDGEMSFVQNVQGMIQTIERLAINAAHAEEPCARILFSTAKLLRVTVLDTLR
jgi:hypothetical protein